MLTHDYGGITLTFLTWSIEANDGESYSQKSRPAAAEQYGAVVVRLAFDCWPPFFRRLHQLSANYCIGHSIRMADVLEPEYDDQEAIAPAADAEASSSNPLAASSASVTSTTSAAVRRTLIFLCLVAPSSR